MTNALVGTADGLHHAGTGEVLLAGREVRDLARHDGAVLALVDGRDILHGGGQEWRSLAVHDEANLTCIASTSAGVLVGTEPAGLLRLSEGGLAEIDAFAAMPGNEEWYTPWGGPPAVRSIASDSDAVYVNVHVGGIARSRDGGASWHPTIDIDTDVHQVVVGDGVVVAALGVAGAGLSQDGGDSWSVEVEGLHAGYCRAAAVTGDHLLVSASTGPGGGEAALYRRPLHPGTPFQQCREGLPEWFEGNIDSGWIGARGDFVAVAVPGGRVYVSGTAGESWHLLDARLPAARCVLAVD